MKFLIVGDIVGKSGVAKLKKEFDSLISKYSIEFSIVNGENSASGRGLRVQEYNEIIDLGVDCITMGNHLYYRKEMLEQYSKLERLLIPINVTNVEGNKSIVINKLNKKIGIINMIGKVNMGEMFINNVINPFEIIKDEINKLKLQGTDYIFIDFHAETTAEKIAMKYFLEDDITCLFGTHTHVQTSDESISGTGMAYITDVGMTGPKESVLGLKKEIALQRFITGNYYRYECSDNEATLNAIIVETDDNTKKAISIQRISID